MRALLEAVLAFGLVACGAPAASTSTVPVAAADPPATPARPRIDAACDGELVVLERGSGAVTYLGAGRYRLRVHDDGTVESAPALEAPALGVAVVDGRWLFACANGSVVAAASPLDSLAEVGRFVPPPRVRVGEVSVQHGALGLLGTEAGTVRPLRIDADGSVHPLALPPVTRVFYESASSALLVFVGGGLGRLDAQGRTSGAPLGDGDRVAALGMADDGAAVAIGASGALSRDAERVPCDPEGRAAAALAAAREAEARATPALRAGPRDVFVDEDGGAPAVLRVVSHPDGSELARVALPSATCSPDTVGDAIVAICDAADETERMDLFWLDADQHWSAVARADEITSEPGASPLGYREVLPSGARDCFVVESGQRTCFPDGASPLVLGATACALRRARSTAVAVRVVDLVTGRAEEAPIPAALRRGTWSTSDDLAPTCAVRREASDGSSVLYRVVVGDGAASLALEAVEPRVVHLSITCCFAREAFDCAAAPRAEPAPAWAEIGPDDGVAAIHLGARSIPVGPSESPDGDFLRGLVVYDDGSALATLEGGPSLRSLHVGGAGGSTAEATRDVFQGPLALGTSVLALERRDDVTLVRRDRTQGALVAARALDVTGPFARQGGVLGLFVDDVFVPLDPRDPPVRLEPVPDALADFDCRWPPPCEQAPSAHATIVYEPGGVLEGVDSAAWIGVEHDGARTCVRELITPYGEVLAIANGVFVGTTVVGSARADVTCSARR